MLSPPLGPQQEQLEARTSSSATLAGVGTRRTLNAELMRGAATLYLTVGFIVHSLLLSDIPLGILRPWVHTIVHQIMPMIFADLVLARRLEAVDGHACSQFAEARKRLFPASGSTWTRCAGATAVSANPADWQRKSQSLYFVAKLAFLLTYN
jgi:hypothetical protein